MAASTSAAGPVAHHFDNMNQQQATVRLGMWLFLVTEVLFFGGAFCAYTAYRIVYPNDFEAGSAALNVGIAAVNTFILLASSLTITLAIRSAYLADRSGLKRNLLFTIFLCCTFLGLKAREYHLDYEEGLLPGHYTRMTDEAEKHLAEERAAIKPLLARANSSIATQTAIVLAELDKEKAAKKDLEEARKKADSAAVTAAIAKQADAKNAGALAAHKLTELNQIASNLNNRLNKSNAFNENLAVVLSHANYKPKSIEHIEPKETEKEISNIEQLSKMPSDEELVTKRKEQERYKSATYDPWHVQLFFMFYYSMTGLHVLHMVVGLGLLTWQFILASRGFFDFQSRYVYIEAMSLYWHFVDMAWMFLLPLLYLCGPHTAEQAIKQFKHALGMH